MNTLQQLVAALPFGVMVWRAESDDPAGLRLIHANAEASKQAGIDLSGHCGRTVKEIFPEALRAPHAYNVPELWHRVAVRQEREALPAMPQLGSGDEPRWINAYAAPIGDRMVASIYEDITDRIRAEQEIRSLNRELERSADDRQRRYRTIFDSAPVALCETDLERLQVWLEGLHDRGASLSQRLRKEPDLAALAASLWPVLKVNDSAARILGVHRPQDAPTSLGDLVRGASENAWVELLLALARGASSFETELSLETFEGDKTVVLRLVVPQERADYGHVVVSLFDITERKRLEQELWAAQRMESIGQLTGGVAHDFNNLLMVIGSYAGFVLEAFPEGDPAREDVRVILDATNRAASLTNQLLAFSRKQVQQLEVIELNDVVGELEKMLRRVIGEHIALHASLQRPLGTVKADRSQVQQILMNLAVNSRDAMEHGGKLIIETSNVDVVEKGPHTEPDSLQPGAYVMLAVTDTGCGMDEDTRRRAFDPFFSTKGVGRGTGLGLSTVYGIIKQSQGYVVLDTQVGRGTTVKIYLPRILDKSASVRPPATHDAARKPHETVLLVEDEERVRTATRRILEKRGYRVLEASDGQDALAVSLREGGAIHALITDVVMPNMSGPELAMSLSGTRPDMKVVFVSGYTDNALVRQTASARGAAYVQKPFAPDTLLRTLRDLLDATH